MTKETAIKLFEQKEVRSLWSDEDEKWYFSIIDIISILTDEITKAWSGFTTKQYKNLKDLKKENLRDHMTNLELALNMLAEATTTEISKEKNPITFQDKNHQHLIPGNCLTNIQL
jgi:hypothetical protein